MRMERDGRSSLSEFDYNWVDNVVMETVSYYQMAAQLRKFLGVFPDLGTLKVQMG